MTILPLTTPAPAASPETSIPTPEMTALLSLQTKVEQLSEQIATLARATECLLQESSRRVSSFRSTHHFEVPYEYSLPLTELALFDKRTLLNAASQADYPAIEGLHGSLWKATDATTATEALECAATASEYPKVHVRDLPPYGGSQFVLTIDRIHHFYKRLIPSEVALKIAEDHRVPPDRRACIQKLWNPEAK